jgi:hypothetical protein
LLVVAAVFGLSLAGFVLVDLMSRAGRGELNQVEAAVVARRAGLAERLSQRSMVRSRQVAATLLVVMSLLTAIAVVRVGDSGAKAVWHGRVSASGTR